MDFADALRLLRRGTESLPERIAAFSDEIDEWPAERILEQAAAAIPHLVVTSSFGADSVVMLHLVHRVAADVPVMFLDTGYHFAETLAFRKELADSLSLRVVDVQPEPWVRRQALRLGDELPQQDADKCCRLRKTLPMQAALHDVDGWVTGIRRSATRERAKTPVVQAWRQDGRWLLKIAPIAHWKLDDVNGYIETHGLPRHPLVELGYASIGCAPCTAPVFGGDDARAGRWAGMPAKTECGLHLAQDGPDGPPQQDLSPSGP